MSSCPSFSVITPLQFLPSITLAQRANTRPLTHRKAPIQWRGQTARLDHQKITDHEYQPVPGSLRATFAIDRALGREGPQQPEYYEDYPADTNDAEA